MSHKIDSITQPTSGACVPVGTKVLDNAVITGAAEQCKCHDGGENTLIRQYEAMKEEAAAARDEFVQKARGLDDIAHETRATSNRNAILNAIGNLNFSKPFAEKVGNTIIFHDVTPRQLAQLTRIIGKKVPSLEPSELYFFIVTDPNDEDRRNLKVGAYGIEFTETAFSFADGDDGLVVSKIEVDLPGEEYAWEFVGVSYFGYDDIISDGDLSWRIADLRQWLDEKIDSLVEKVTPCLYDLCTAEDIDHMFDANTEDGQIIIPAEAVQPGGSISLNLFTAITGLTPVVANNEQG